MFKEVPCEELDMSLETIGRENVTALQSHVAGRFDVLALTAYESFEQLVFTPVMDMPVPHLVLIPGEGPPRIVCQAIGAELTSAESTVTDDHVHVYHPHDVTSAGGDEPAFETAVEAALANVNVESVGIDFQHTTRADVDMLAETLPGTVADCSEILQTVYRDRTPAEVEYIQAAAEVAERGVEAVLAALEPGLTEYELAAIAEREMTAAGARARPYDLHCTSGEHTLDPVRRLSRKPLQQGELLVLDFLPKVDHYFADIARTVTVAEEPTAEQRELQTTVLAALEYIESELRPGFRASEVDAMLREFFAERGFDGDCITHTGHAVGNDWGPRITSADDSELAEGMVVAIEPGLYVDDIGGVRIEDDFLLTEDGVESLMSLPRDPVDLAA